MKNLRPFAFLFFFMLMLAPSAWTNNINTDDIDFRKVRFSETQNPVTYKYIWDYARLLCDTINATIPFKDNWFLEYRYKLHSDGTVSDIKPLPLNRPYKGKPINKIFEEMIKTTTPPSYPENMEIGDVYIELLADSYVVDEIEIYFGRNNDGAPNPGNYIAIYLPVKNTQKFFRFYR